MKNLKYSVVKTKGENAEVFEKYFASQNVFDQYLDALRGYNHKVYCTRAQRDHNDRATEWHYEIIPTARAVMEESLYLIGLSINYTKIFWIKLMSMKEYDRMNDPEYLAEKRLKDIERFQTQSLFIMQELLQLIRYEHVTEIDVMDMSTAISELESFHTERKIDNE